MAATTGLPCSKQQTGRAAEDSSKC
jgi:hypothetical protein